MHTPISRTELAEKLSAGAPVTVVEALPAKYYAKVHIAGALNLPHDEVDALAPRLLPDKSREVVVYCADAKCPNSSLAADALVQLGYENVREYVEGKADWIAAGLATEGVRASA